ncbi:hypothetical protein AB2B41_08955 [Marimonas sp. MJW-29]|uniref:PH domain-containing protein n=1 Tax=Sulfitobacter sediminis TaxID=3234186 RepID=A0ABV3RL76_9RHOB
MDRIEPDELSWAPVRRVFLRRVLIRSAMTFAALLAVVLLFAIFATLPAGWGLLGAAILTAGFAIEDLLRWRNARADLWQISDGHFLHDDIDGRLQVPLSEIADARHQFGGRVTVRLHSGQRIVMRYLPFPAETAAQLRAAAAPPPKRDPQ